MELCPSISSSSTITEPSLNPQNLSTALETMPEKELYNFIWRLNVPQSKQNEIKSQYNTHKGRKVALLSIYLSDHPAPSWQHVTDALYRHKLHAVLEKVQTMFPTGKYIHHCCIELVLSCSKMSKMSALIINTVIYTPSAVDRLCSIKWTPQHAAQP